MYKTILVPLDGSRRAEKILPYVEDIAKTHESTILVMQVVEPGVSLSGPYDTSLYYDKEAADRAIEEARQYVESVVEQLHGKGIAAREVIEFGPVTHAILEVAAREDADLIGMASHGRTGLARAFYGSVASGILHQADRPILLIRASHPA